MRLPRSTGVRRALHEGTVRGRRLPYARCCERKGTERARVATRKHHLVSPELIQLSN